MTSKERCIAAIKGNPTDRVPVFPLIMGLAAAQKGITYKQYASNGGLLAEAQVFTADKFNFDAVTACSDAFRIATGLGGEIIYEEKGPPHIASPVIQDRADLNRLKGVDILKTAGRCMDRVRGVSEMVKAVGDRLFVLGWVDLPFAEACSCIGVQQFMYMMADDPDLAHDVLRFLTVLVKDFAQAQLEQGAHMIGCGDAAASLISPDMFLEFALPYEQEVISDIQSKGGLVKTHICGDTSKNMENIAQNGSDLFNIDHMVDLQAALTVFGGAGKAVKGNLDPVTDIYSANREHTYEAALACISMAEGYRYILSAGCEIPAGAPEENLHALYDAVIAYKRL